MRIKRLTIISKWYLSCKISKIMRNKNFDRPTGGQFGFYYCEICHGLFLCKTLHFV